MSVEKTFGYGNASPYRSDTFNKNNDLIFGRNGALVIQSISNSGPNVAIEDISFVQEGVIVRKIGTSTVTFPTSMPVPFYLTASVPNTYQVDNIAWSFVKRPIDIGTNTVLIAEWDGNEWRHLNQLSIDKLIEHRLVEATAYNNVGFNQGFHFVPNPSFTQYTFTPGIVTDKTGFLVEKHSETTFNALATDPEYDRLDGVLWRRENDSEFRIGRPIHVPGPTFLGDTLVKNHQTSLGTPTNANSTPKIINLTDNSVIIAWLENYGANGIIKAVKYAADRTTVVVSTTTIASNVQEFDVVADASDNLMFVYTSGGDLVREKRTSALAVIVSPGTIDGLTNTTYSPTVRVDSLGNFIVTFLYAVSPTLLAPYFLKMNTGGSLATSSKKLINSVSSYSKVHFDVDMDYMCHVAFHNAATNQIEYQVVSEIGDPVTTKITISDDTQYYLVNLTGSARNPTVQVSDNNEVFISFEQAKNTPNYGVAVYTPDYIDVFGHKCKMRDLSSSSENILDHTFDLDWGNHAYILARTSTELFYFNIFLQYFSSRLDSVFPVNAAASGTFAIKYDIAGSLVYAFTNATSGTTNNGSPVTGLKFGPNTYGAENEFVTSEEVAIPLASVLALSPLPTIGDTFVVASSTQGNDGTYTIQSSRDVLIDSVSYRVFKKTSGTFNAENIGTVTSQFTYKNGNAIYFAKQTGTIEYSFQELIAEELNTDIFALMIRRSDDHYLTWYDEALVPTGYSTVREESFLTSEGSINWNVSLAGGTLAWSTPIYIRDPFRGDLKIATGSVGSFIEKSVLYIRLPVPSPFTKDGDADGFGVITLENTDQFAIGQTVFIGDSDHVGTEAVVTNVTSTQLIFLTTMVDYIQNRGAYVIPVDVTPIVGLQNTGDLKPDSLGLVDKNIFTIAYRSENLVQFRDGALTLEDGEDGNIGDGPGDDTLAYIGASSAADTDPNYSSNYGGVNGENLTSRLGTIDLTAYQTAQDKNVIDLFPKNIIFQWNATSGVLTWSNADWYILVPNVGAQGVHHTIKTGTKTLTLATNQVAYIDIDRSTGSGDITPIIVNDNAVPLDLSNRNHMVIARRFGTDIIIGTKAQFTLATLEKKTYWTDCRLIKGGNWTWVSATNTLSWSSSAYIQIKEFSDSVNTIPAGNISITADGMVAYVDLNRASPGGNLTVLTAMIGALPINENLFIIARRIGSNVLVGNNLLETKAVVQLDYAYSNNYNTLLGFSSNGQETHTYSSTQYITQSTSHEDALGIFDLAIDQILTQLNNPPDSYYWLADGSVDTFVIGTGGYGDAGIVFDTDNTANDVIVTIDGIVVDIHRAGTWPIGDGDSDGEFIKSATNTIRIKPSMLSGAGVGTIRKKVMIRPYTSGATNIVAVQDEGSTITSHVTVINFSGAGVTASETSPGVVDVIIPGGGGGGGGGASYELITVTNETGVPIPANKAIRFLANGRIEPADSVVVGKQNPTGVTVALIPNNTTVTDGVAVGYRIPGILSGMGFGFNERVFLGQNGDIVNEASIPDTGAITDAVLALGEAYGSGSGTTDLLWNKQEYASI